jgi:starvation-inducible DNA-binding protein
MAKTKSAKEIHVRERLGTPTDLKPEATRDVSAALAGLLADVFALYVKTKNFHWHMSGPHFRDYHLLLDEQGEQVFDMTDDIAEWARKISRADSAFSTTTPIMSIRRTCWRSCATTMSA